MNRGAKIVFDLNPSVNDFAMAIDADLREWTLSFKEDMLEKMVEELSRHHMEDRTDDITPSHWSKMMDADEEAFRLAIRQELAKCDDVKQEHWGEDRKVEMDENGKLIQQIYSSNKNRELLDLSKEENVKPFIDLLQPDNLPLFYDIIVRRSLIQCEMFPELKIKHEKWLKRYRGNLQEESVASGASFSLTGVLGSDIAQKYWERLRQRQFVDDHYMLLDSTTRQQTAYIAELFSEKLGIKTKWKTFEDFWGINYLAQEKNQWLEKGKLPSCSGEIDDIFSD